MFTKVDKALISAIITFVAFLGQSYGWFEMGSETQVNAVEFFDWIRMAIGGLVAGAATYGVPNK